MDADEIRKVKTICQTVRRKLYVVARVEQFDGEFTGLCARASAKLFTALVHSGYNPLLAYSKKKGRGHVFIRLNDYIVDITASQFGHPDILIIKARKSRPWYWREHELFDSIHLLREKQINQGWPVQQVAKKERKVRENH